MTTAEIATIVVGGILLYGICSGIAWQRAGANWDSPGPTLAAIFWPLLLPAILGAGLARRLANRGPRLPEARVVGTGEQGGGR